MQCNIDSRGRMVRLIGGLVTLGIAVVLSALALTSVISAGWIWIVIVAAGLGGAFQVFEARQGWCALRAVGIRTPV